MSYIIRNFDGAIDEEHLVYILPNASLLDEKTLQIADEKEVALGGTILSFDHLVTEVLESRLNVIDWEQKGVLMKRGFDSLLKRGDLEYYGHMAEKSGFFTQLNMVITEFKRNLLSYDELLLMEDRRFREVGLLFSEYERLLEESGLYDREDEYIECIKRLSDQSMQFHFNAVVISEFIEFRTIELELIAAMVDRGVQVEIHLPYEMERENALVKETLESFKNFYIEEAEDELNDFQSIGKYLLSRDESIYGADIKVIRGKSIYYELKKVVERLKSENLKYPLEEMSIVLASSDYLPVLLEIAEEEDINLDLSYGGELKDSPMVRELLNILEILDSGGSKAQLINYLKNYYFKTGAVSNVEAVERQLRTLDFNGLWELKQIIKSNEDLVLESEFLTDIQSFIEDVDGLLNSFEGDDLAEDLEAYIEDVRMLDAILADSSFELVLKRDIASYNGIEKAITSLKTAMSQMGLKKSECISLFMDYLKSGELNYRTNSGGVKVYNFIESIGAKSTVRFICGLNASYPNVDSGNFLIKQKHLTELKSVGIKVRTYDEQIDNEILKFSRAVANTSDSLYLSYTSADRENVDDSSFLLRDVVKRIGVEEMKDVLIQQTSSIKGKYEEVTTDRDLFLKVLYSKDEEAKSHISTSQLESYGELNDSVTCEVERYKVDSPFNGRLLDEDNIEYIKHSFKDFQFSSSSLETYMNCKYLFFAQYVLKLKQMARDCEDEFYIDRGNVMHDILQEFYVKHGGEIRSLSAQVIEAEVKRIGEEVFSKARMPIDKSENRIYLEIISNWIIQLILVDIERLSENNYTPSEYELEFRHELVRDEDRVKLRGRVDRLDSDGIHNTVIDYKASGSPSQTSIREGKSIQMALYALGIERVEEAVYGLVRSGEFKNAFRLGEKSVVRSNVMTKSEYEEFLKGIEDLVVDTYREILSGDFAVTPVNCREEQCEYWDICRYNGELVSEDEA